MSDDGEGDFMNIDPETAWLESTTIGGFRVWHIIAICLGILMSIIIMVCCCIRFRIPRTKQEIEADYQRKQITKKFREKLQQIKNSEMDDMDLQKAIEYILSNYLIKQCNSEENLDKDPNKFKTNHISVIDNEKV
ncbi:transmembrane inner ear expressed protein isoform X2 [Stomoxys calcitrans]|uniref:Transmembrane inner ear expressed protein n=1 Tax=Stomoxys calcitrans TaxID=35570 RepID=A0A1I8PFF1_STOCA|nr:transmembrane inner ear expressed protein isoform X2 [Stomoxys calcitrans]